MVNFLASETKFSIKNTGSQLKQPSTDGSNKANPLLSQGAYLQLLNPGQTDTTVVSHFSALFSFLQRIH